MRRVLLALSTLLLVAVLCEGCTLGTLVGSGNVVTRQEDISDFDRVKVGHGFRVTIRQAETFSVVLRVDDNLVPHLQVAREGRTLTIGLRPGRAYSLGLATREATVTMPELAGLDVGGGSRADITVFRSDNALTADVSGGSHLEGNIEAGDIRLEVSGGSRATLSGAGSALTLDCSGGSHADLSDLTVDDARVEVSGGGDATVNVSGRLDVEASGGSRLYYLGQPSLGSVDVSGGARLSPR